MSEDQWQPTTRPSQVLVGRLHKPEFTNRASQGPEEVAFHTALLATPTDDTTRLVYADWCEEHGKLEKATWLRSDQARQWFALAKALHDGLDGLRAAFPKVIELTKQVVDVFTKEPDR